MQKWDVVVNTLPHEIVYEGSKVSGMAKLRIDGYLSEYKPVIIKGVGLFYFFDIVDSEFILQLDIKTNAPLALIQDRVDLITGLPMEDDLVARLREGQSVSPPTPLGAKHRTYMGSFLTFVILTYVNIFLMMVNSAISFPFSATVPQLLWALGWYSQDFVLPVPSSLLLIAGFAAAAVYIVLYLLSRKRTWPILTALILIALDTGFLIYLSLGDFTRNIVDILFHFWVLWSITQLFRTRRKLKKEELGE